MTDTLKMKPGDVHYVVGVKDAYRVATGKTESFNSTEARKWFRKRGVTIYQLPFPVPDCAVKTEEP